jgi:hypothetical protein
MHPMAIVGLIFAGIVLLIVLWTAIDVFFLEGPPTPQEPGAQNPKLKRKNLGRGSHKTDSGFDVSTFDPYAETGKPSAALLENTLAPYEQVPSNDLGTTDKEKDKIPS